MVTKRTAPGSNLPATDEETLIAEVDETLGISLDAPPTPAPLTVLAVDIAQVAQSNDSIQAVVRKATDLMPADKQAAEEYVKHLQRMRGIVETIFGDTRAAFYWKFGP